MTNHWNLRLGPLGLFLCLLFAQVYLMYATDWKDNLVGDEFYYVGKAREVESHGWFDKLTQDELEISRGKKRGNSDYRPPAYSLFLYACGAGEADLRNLRLRCSWIQMFVLILPMILVFVLISGLIRHRAINWFWAFLVGIQPWTFGYVKLLYPDTLVAGVLTLAAFILSVFVISRKRGVVVVSGVTTGILFVVAFSARPELSILALLLIAIAVMLKVYTFREGVTQGAISVVAVLILGVILNVGYRVSIGDEARPFGVFRYDVSGGAKWAETWLNHYKLRLNLEYFLDEGYKFDPSVLPPRAIGDEQERAALKKIARILETEGYTDEVDTIFNGLADKRIKEHIVLNHYLPKLWFTAEGWINYETNSQLLAWLAHAPRWLRLPILVFLLVLKGLLFALFVYSIYRVTRRFKSGEIEWPDVTAIIMVSVVLGRTVLLFAVNVFVTKFGATEPRYMLVAWPALLWCAGYCLVSWNRREEVFGVRTANLQR